MCHTFLWRVALPGDIPKGWHKRSNIKKKLGKERVGKKQKWGDLDGKYARLGGVVEKKTAHTGIGKEK